MKKALLIIGMLLIMAVSTIDARSETLTHNQLIKKARTCLNNGDAQATVKYARQALDIDQSSASAHYFVARGLDKLGDADAAIQEYETSLSYEPDNFFALNNAGLLYLRKDDLDSALELLEQAVSTDEPEAYAFNNLGYVYERLGMKENAIDAYKKSVAMNPDYIRASDNLIRVTAEYDAGYDLAKDGSKTVPKKGMNTPELSYVAETTGYYQKMVDLTKNNNKHAMNY